MCRRRGVAFNDGLCGGKEATKVEVQEQGTRGWRKMKCGGGG